MLKHCRNLGTKKDWEHLFDKVREFFPTECGHSETVGQRKKKVAVEQRGRDKCGRKEIVQNVCFYAMILATCPILSNVQNSVSSRIQKPTHSEKGEWETIGILFSLNGPILNHKETQSLVHEEV
jgi:hypothetical protein